MINAKEKGLVIVISAPSGAGKSTICGEILQRLPNSIFSVSVTTRKPRQNEVEGKDYYFITEEKFKDMVMKSELAEWAFVHENYYGTPKKYLEDTIKSGKDIILDIDVQGGKKIKQIYPDCVSIFIMPPSWEILEMRLRSRAQDSEVTIQRRLENAKGEFAYVEDYDYLVINDVLEDAVNLAMSVIRVEHRKISRLSEDIRKYKL
ncbi:MAG: guanylate kinase [Elusimicrobiota bacterium]